MYYIYPTLVLYIVNNLAIICYIIFRHTSKIENFNSMLFKVCHKANWISVSTTRSKTIPDALPPAQYRYHTVTKVKYCISNCPILENQQLGGGESSPLNFALEYMVFKYDKYDI